MVPLFFFVWFYKLLDFDLSEFLLYAASLLGPVSILSCKILLEMSLFISWSIMRWKPFICFVEES